MPAVGAHVDSTDPLAAARDVGAQVVQFFLADPQGWKKPTEHPQAEALKASGLTIYIHSPYVLNVASLNNRIASRAASCWLSTPKRLRKSARRG
jgi:deoxyribonuclease-4